MRCRYCGSKAIYPYKMHEQATAGRVVAGALIAGPIGAVAGLAGKNVKGYRCSACGMFSDQPMDNGEEVLINWAVRDARNGKTDVYERYHAKYANIEFVTIHSEGKQANALLTGNNNGSPQDDIEMLPEAEPTDEYVKHSYAPNQFVVGSPLFISNVTIMDSNGTDVLLLDVHNISGKTLRSVYLNITVYDDVGDQITTGTFAYQGLSSAAGEQLPQAKPFNLNTNVAYRVDVTCEKAAFADNSIWRKEESQRTYPLPERIELVPERFTQHKYLRVLLSKKGVRCADWKLYYPAAEETHRLCICGNPALKGQSCPSCGLNEAELQEVMDYDVLIQCRKDVIERAAKARTEALQKLSQQAQEERYQEARQLLDKGLNESNFTAAAKLFESLSNYKDSSVLANECYEKAEIARKDAILAAGKAKMTREIIANYEAAIRLFESISGWKDADEKANECKRKIEELKAAEEADRLDREQKAEITRIAEAKQKKRNIIIGVSVSILTIILITTLILLDNLVWTPNQYDAAIALYEAGKYTEAVEEFSDLGTYEDSENWVKKAKYEYILGHKNNTDKTTYEYLKSLQQDNYKDSANIYDILYAWKVEIVVNKSETDTKNNTVSIVKPGDMICVHINVSGGNPGGFVYVCAEFWAQYWRLLDSSFFSSGDSECAWIKVGSALSTLSLQAKIDDEVVASTSIEIDK